MTENEQKDKGLVEQYHESERKQNEGKPWSIRHKSTLLILGLTVLGWAFCAAWSHYFPYGIW